VDSVDSATAAASLMFSPGNKPGFAINAMKTDLTQNGNKPG